MKQTRVVIPRHEQAAVFAAISRERIESNEPKNPNEEEPSTTRREPKNLTSTGLVSAPPRDCPSTSGPVSGHPTRFQRQLINPRQTNFSSLSIGTDTNSVANLRHEEPDYMGSGAKSMLRCFYLITEQFFQACTKTYAAWRNTQVTLSPEDFARMMSHQEAVRKLNVLRKNNELSGKLTLDFNSAYVECPLGQRFRVLNVYLINVNNPTVLLSWEMIPKDEVAAWQARHNK
ncbi:hypothetical protein CAEBREN_10949 [Caenorhabditis brenneri]|uniref:Uncharacterized protein n=1 Tax=Caenorhabditis brenneri TaxID=135651 RepID=G0PA39_CAEBE|nr:hypothetical protein CAEBREN_10949 [Caenorhabditis brenneri]